MRSRPNSDAKAIQSAVYSRACEYEMTCCLCCGKLVKLIARRLLDNTHPKVVCPRCDTTLNYRKTQSLNKTLYPNRIYLAPACQRATRYDSGLSG